MRKLTFIKGYQDNEQLRNSFNQLALNTFGIEFETWYQHGFWTEKYQPYSYIDNGMVVANVSVNLLNLVINDETKPAIQIGTVMTHPDYRDKGLARRLMEKVLEDFKHVDIIYLFANQTVLDFYPKFGFQRVEEVQFSMGYSHKPSPNPPTIKKLDGGNSKDLAFIYSLAADRISGTRTFGTSTGEELLMFYSIMVFGQDLYYLEEEKALVIYQTEGDTLHLYDMVCREKINVHGILTKIATGNINKVVFHFHPDVIEVAKLDKQQHQTSNPLFIKNQTNIPLPAEFKHPFTSQA
ncbi:GCN5-like N-acetyltransferase [Neobacillus bataviensis LMG 21833]|uniref:GCN5-like N-acetyltransferase n=1 Tax=Neobacillus bataviensis LMG 21833 TaxID=1117379 RepID=K6CCC6_9BACI|nr:GNAT family N-acetyltransferase [Neobacillus bataviensis]EKN68795.1 GCN5-like N-acetyltransferase [Neobacillus bataviensis LMG 21833]